MQHHQLRLCGARVKVQPLMLSLVIHIYWGQHTIVCSGRAVLSSVLYAGDDEEGGICRISKLLLQSNSV